MQSTRTPVDGWALVVGSAGGPSPVSEERGLENSLFYSHALQSLGKFDTNAFRSVQEHQLAASELQYIASDLHPGAAQASYLFLEVLDSKADMVKTRLAE